MTQAITSFDGEYRWLSNFWPVDIEWAGRQFLSLEHAYQASKAALDEDVDRIQVLETPGKAKRAGQKLAKQGKMRADWLHVRAAIMDTLLRRKFSPGSDLWWNLANTEDAEIVEGNSWHDTFWGSCTCDECPPGENTLGRMLMALRREIQQEIWEDTHFQRNLGSEESKKEQLRNLLLTIGGKSAGLPEKEPDINLLLERGKLFKCGSLRYLEAVPTDPEDYEGQNLFKCHQNAAWIWKSDPARYQLVTGYADAGNIFGCSGPWIETSTSIPGGITYNGVYVTCHGQRCHQNTCNVSEIRNWIQHSWCYDTIKKMIVDSQFAGNCYFGVILSDDEAEEFYQLNIGPWISYLKGYSAEELGFDQDYKLPWD